MKTFGQIIRESRESKGLLLRQVAASIDIDPSLLSRIEMGIKRPTREQAVQLASHLHEDPDTLIVLWLSERVAYQLEGEVLALEAITVAEKLIRYRQGGTNKK